jgi:ectoine hydroxylase-related dioxygenase (phytanoyl-CoA dioxygenase family)
LTNHGAERCPGILSEATIGLLQDVCDQHIGAKPGIRLYQSAAISDVLCKSSKVSALAQRFLGDSVRPVHAVMFDKSRDTNWALGWHQDRTISVRERIDVAGYGPWTVKAGSVHVEPPFDVIRQMITLRLHLDDVDQDNAPLQIAPGSHHIGRIPASEIDATVTRLGSRSCVANAGDVWVYSTGILHASDKATRPRRRRVLHVDFSAENLPGGLDWSGIGDIDLA